ncbi:MAG TPA: response regulator [Ferruginibacter sp.]|nr:response regulator [Ferruginibacter sp.]
MAKKPLNLLLADDDNDDCIFFKEALEEIPVETELATVSNGVEVMELLLQDGKPLPDVLYLDLNMPLMNGFEVLQQIKKNKKLKKLPVIVFSTSCNPDTTKQLQKEGAQYYIQKPPEFGNLKKIIHTSLLLIMKKMDKNENVFLLNPQ